MNIGEVWTEKYRPQTIEEVLLSDKDKKYFTELVTVPNNLLFLGSPGIGKSTVAKVLAKKFSPNSYLYIKASEQGNIDTVRTLITEFISVLSMDGRQKIVILDEADGISKTAQEALRSVMEENLDSVKFILTANYKNRLIHALRSRCNEFEFSCSQKQVLQLVVDILRKEKIVILKEEVPNISILMKEYFPDIRKTINEFQKASITGTFLYKKSNRGGFAKEIKESLKAGEDVFAIRSKVVENTEKFSGDYHALMKDLFGLYVSDGNVTACILVTEFMFRHSTVLDAEINFSALLFNLKLKL